MCRNQEEVTSPIFRKMITLCEADKELFLLLKPERYFGPSDWQVYFDIKLPESITLPIPVDQLQAILESPCPFVKDKKVKETHYLFYLPDDLSGESLTIEKWQEMLPLGSKPTFCGKGIKNDPIFKNYDYAKADIARFSWYLMLEGVVPGSESKNWKEQLVMMPEKYDIPKLVECTPIHFLFL